MARQGKLECGPPGKASKVCSVYETTKPEELCEDDAFSDISSDSDIFHADVFGDKHWTTPEDADMEIIDHLASLLRRRPLLPPHPTKLAICVRY